MYRSINIQSSLTLSRTCPFHRTRRPHTSSSDSNPHTSSHNTSQYFQSDNDKRQPIYTHADLRVPIWESAPSEIGDGIVDDLFRASGLGQLSAHASAVLQHITLRM
ncbi:hypothetical protein BDR05DRAFT_957825 [Suillus weaverae]|nr:hypothetical protein BDR05DRAFT_957825 [Suillus weaverae]